jgi:hypothetical protein
LVDGTTTEYGGIYIQIKDHYFAMPEKSYAIEYSTNSEQDSDQFLDAINKHGLSNKSVYKLSESQASSKYIIYSNDKGYLCGRFDNDLYIRCGHTRWISDERKEFFVGLLDAYKEGALKDDDIKDYYNADSNYLLFVLESDIKSSKNKPYQTIVPGTYDGHVLMYRKGEKDKWHYFCSGNGICEECEFMSLHEDAKKAFEGRCFDDKSFSWTTIE